MIFRTALAGAGAAALLLAGGGVALAGTTAGTTAGAPVAPAPVAPASVTPTPAPPAAAGEITSDEAVAIAERSAPGAVVVKVERVWEQGLWTWWVQMEKGVWRYDLYISTKTGRVVRLKINYIW
ncbi:peptidase [Planomonospora sp. ID67723]|uniref:PepSY domain-containing protein n=1 Tax=Planomonospora sp. ID67723 TaxID=2738134 RepID=UPI0018C42906|nr:PepSY domain-containing protein [Planomonospora sp. ID67723]MBG0828885.1 peptidase [Planomonospora sp. ID67723]